MPPPPGASSGGSGARSFSSGFGGGAGGGLSAAGITLNLYLDGVLMTAQQLSQRLGVRVRLTGETT
jgi:hypothetical protein